MIGALVYLQVTTLKNALWSRIQRLRQPRYLFAVLVGAAYFYFSFFHHVAVNNRPAHGSHLPVGPADWTGLLEPVGALMLFVAVALTWILPNSRAALAFTEAEVAFLFPAPVSRRTLVHFKLIKSQLGILFSSLLMTLISNRWTFLGGNAWTHAAGWWLIFSLFNLHRIGASFARERLLDLGMNARRRRIAGVGALVSLGLVTWLWLSRTLPALREDDFSSGEAMIAYAKAVLAAPPLSWVLMPFGLVVRPFLAGGGAGFVAALWPVLLLLAGHYLWVVRSDVAFEEASVALSQKRAERQASVRSGNWRGGGAPEKKRREPFALAPRGAPSTAFLWKSLIAAGPVFYPRNWLVLGAALAGFVIWFGRDPAYQPVLMAVGLFSGVLSAYGLLFGPVLARRGTGQMLERFDLLKSYPVRGWQAVLGELLFPVTVLCLFEWIVFALMALSIGFARPGGEVTPWVTVAAAGSAGLLVVPLAGLLFALNFAGVLYFPAWLNATAQHGAGLERLGQRLIFFAGYLVVFSAALLPAALCGAAPFLLVQLFFHQLALAIPLGALVACAVLAGEFALVLWWLGRRFEVFDLSAELPR